MEKFKKILASILCINILLSSSPVMLFAAAPSAPTQSNITDVVAQDGVYNITPTSVSSNTGIRNYTDFTLAQGDTANLIYTSDYNKFLNLVDNQVNIWGIVNTTNSNGALTNGNAIFVSPSGIIVGPSGVLNVGSAALISTSTEAYNTYKSSPTDDNYTNLITNASGDVSIYGKINASDTVEAYANTIAVEGSTILTGKQVFDSLVNNNAQNASNVTVRDGKVILSATKTVEGKGWEQITEDGDVSTGITVKDTTIESGEISVKATSIMTLDEKAIFSNLYKNWAVAKVNIDASKLLGSKIAVKASTNFGIEPSESYAKWYLMNSNGFVESVSKRLHKVKEIENSDNYIKALGILNDPAFLRFYGAHTDSEVTITNSTIDSTGTLDVGTKASAKIKLKELDASLIATELSKLTVIASGTETKSVVDIKDSTLTAAGDLTTSAVSSNVLDIKLIETVHTKAAFAFPFLTSSTIVDTGINIDKSVLTGKKTDINTFSYESASLNAAGTARVGFDSTFEGSGAAILFLFNSADVKNQINITNESKITSTGDNLNIAALNAGSSMMISTAKSDKSDKAGGQPGEQPGQQKASENIIKAGGSFVFSNVDTKVKVNIDKTVVKSAGALSIKSYLYDTHSNQAVTKQLKGDAKFAAGVAFVYSAVDNANDITITDSEVTSQSDMTVDAVTELPANKGIITIGWVPVAFFEFDFQSGPENTFDKETAIIFKPSEYFVTDKKIKLVPEITMKGFFNNLAGAYTKGKEIAAEASLVFDILRNSTNIVITDSKLTSEKGPVLANAVNSMVNADGVGFPMPAADLTKSDLPKLWRIEDEGGPGGGGAVLAQKFDITSTVTVDKSEITANEGDVQLNAASEQLYTDFTKLASKSKDVDIIGATHVQDMKGSVTATVDNGTKINAKNVQISAGKANAAFAKGKPDKDGISFGNVRKVEDHVTTLDITGAYADAAPGQTEIDIEVAIGAAVNYKNIDRTISATVGKTTINATSGNIDVDALSKTYLINLTMAGAFTEAESSNGNSGAQANNNIGNWQENANAANNPAAQENNNPVQGAVQDAVNNENDQDDNAGNENPAGGNNAANAANAAANPANRKNWSLSAAGSVDVFLDKTNIKATVIDSTLSAQKDINVVSDYDTATVMLSGGISGSYSMGLGAAVNLNFREGGVNSLVSGSTLTATNNTIKANEDTLTVNIAAGIASTKSGPSGNNFDLGGSFVYNTYKPVVKAELKASSTVNGAVDINAKDKIFNIDIAGGIEIFTNGKSGSSKFQLSSSFAGSMDYMGSDILAQVDESSIKEAGSVNVNAEEDVSVIDASAAVGVSTVPATQTAVVFDGSLGIVYEANNVNAYINNSDVYSKNDLIVSALNKADILNVDGTAQYTSAESGIGANGAVNINIHKNNVNAKVDNGTSGKAVYSAGKTSVVADSSEKLDIINAAAAIAKKSTMIASAVSVGVINNTVTAYADGGNKENFFALKGLDVIAEDNAFILSRGGTLAAVYGGQQKSVGIAVAVNIDKVYKNVSAVLKNVTINGLFDVNVKAISNDGMGASNEKDLDNLDEILADAEKENPEGTGLDRDFTEWDMYYNLAGAVGSFGTLSGAFVLKIVKNNIEATVENVNVKAANNLTVSATESSSKNLIAGSLSGTTGRAAVAAHLVRPTDSSTIKATVKNSTVVLNSDDSKLSVIATEDKTDKTILVAGAASNNVGVAGNGLFNLNKSTINANLENTKLDKGSLNVNADEDIDGLRIIVAAGGDKQGEALALNVALNTYGQKVDAAVASSTVGNQSSAVNVNANNKMKTADYLLGLGFTFQGADEAVIGFKNDYSNRTKAYVNDSVFNNSQSTTVTAASQMKTDNRSLAIFAGYQGASIGANIVINDNSSETAADIENSQVKNKGALTVTSDVNDKIDNKNFAFGFQFQGAEVAANLIFNNYRNTSKANVVYNSNYKKTDRTIEVSDINIRANSDRDINTTSVMVGGNFMGAAVNLNLIKTKVDSYTFSSLELDAGHNRPRTVKVANDVNVVADDKIFVANQVGTVSGTIVGGAPQANVVLQYMNGLSEAIISSKEEGLLKANNINVDQNLTFGYKQTGVGITLGAGTIAGDVTLLRLGPSNSYTELEKHAGIEDAVNQAEDVIDTAGGAGESTPTTHDTNLAKLGANVEATGDIKVTSDVVFKGYDGDTLKLNNVNVDLALGGVGVGVKSFKQTTKNEAVLTKLAINKAIGAIKAKNLLVKATYTEDIDVNVVDVKIDAVKVAVAGGSSTYVSNAKTKAFIELSDITLDGNLDLETRIDSKASSSVTDVGIAVADIDVAGYEVKGNAVADASVGEKVNITAKDLNIKSTGLTDYSGTITLVKVSGINIGFVSTAAQNNTKFNALIKRVESMMYGNTKISVENLNILTGYDKLNVFSKNNAVKISGLDIMSDDAKAKLNAEFTSGFELDQVQTGFKVNIKVSGTTTVETAKKLGADVMTAEARIHPVKISVVSGIDVGSTAEAENNVKSNTKLIFNHDASSSEPVYGLETKNLVVNANLEAQTNAKGSDTAVTGGLGIKSIDVNAKSDTKLNVIIKGDMSIENEATVNANHIADSQADLSSFDATLLVNVDVNDLKSNLNADTVVRFNVDDSASYSGYLKFGKFTTNLNTLRTGKLDLSASGGGAIHVGSPTAENTIKGISEIYIYNLTVSDGKNGDFTFTSNSHSVLDSTSHSSSGGFIAVQNDGKYNNFDTSSKVTIVNSKIGYKEQPVGLYSIDVKNTEMVKDSASNKGGGFIFVSNEDAKNTYKASSLLFIKNSKIYGTDLNFSASTDIRTDTDDFVKYTSKSGGLISVNGIGIENELIQDNKIIINDDIEHDDATVISGTGLVEFNVAPSFLFKQEAGAGSSGFVAWPSSSAKLSSKNTNQITLGKSVTVEGEIVQFFFDANGELSTYAHVKSKDFGSKPSSYSKVSFNLDNNFDIKDSSIIHAKAFLDIEFMSKSKVDISQEAYSEHKAIMPFTKENGEANRTIKNNLTVQRDFDANMRPILQTDRDMNITFSAGSGSTESNIHYKIVYYALFGKTSKGSKSKKNISYTPRFVLNGDIVSGFSEQKKLVIGIDGKVVESSGFAEGEYTITDGREKSGYQLKGERLEYLQNRLDTVEKNLDELNRKLDDLNSEQYWIDRARTKFFEFYDDLSNLMLRGKLATRDLEEVWGHMISDIKAEMGDKYNQEIMDSIIDQMDGFENFENYSVVINSMDIPEEYKQPFIDGFEAIAPKVQILSLETGYNDLNTVLLSYYGGTDVFDDPWYELAVPNDDMSVILDEIVETNNRLQQLMETNSAELKSVTEVKAANEQVREIILDAMVEAINKPEERYSLEYNPYAYVFDDMYLYGASHVNIEGLPDYNGNKEKYPDPDDVAIEGDRKLQFNVAKPGGVLIENYSDYSLVFGSIDLTDKDGVKYINAVIDRFDKIDLSKLKQVESLASSLVINGVDREDLISTPEPTIKGVTIKNLRNEENPFYLENKKTTHTDSYTGNIFVKGSITTTNIKPEEYPVTIFAQSGNIVINGLNSVEGRNTSIEAPQGVIHLKGLASETDSEGRIVLKLNPTDKVFAGKGVTLIGDTFILNGSITSGVTDRTFVLPPATVTPSKDPTTGKDILLHIDGNDIDALLLDDKIYLFDVKNYQGYLAFVQPYRKNQIDINSPYGSGEININHGFGKIDISEPSGGVLNNNPLIIGKIINVSDTYQDVTVVNAFNNPSSSLYLDNVYLNGTRISQPGAPLPGRVVANVSNDGSAQTKVSSLIGGVNLNNYVVNGMFIDEDEEFFRDKTDITHNLTIEEEKSSINVNASLIGSGYAYLNTDKRSDLHISDSGSLDFPFAIIWDDKKTNEDIEAQNVTADALSFETYADTIVANNMAVGNYGYFESFDKMVVVDNHDIRHVSNAPVKLYTALEGGFDVHINDSKIVETSAPVIYTTGDILVKNPLGYHTFETISLSKAAKMSESSNDSINPLVKLNSEERILEEDVELIVDEQQEEAQ